MARRFLEDPEFTQISAEDKAKRDRIVAIINSYTQNMDRSDYYESNDGVSEDDYEDIADDIMREFGI